MHNFPRKEIASEKEIKNGNAFQRILKKKGEKSK